MVTDDSNKPWYKSKTFWASIVTAVLPVIPGVAPVIALYPEAYSAVLGAVFGALRITTKEPIVIRKPKVLP